MPLVPWRSIWDMDEWFEDEWSENWPERLKWGRLSSGKEPSIVRSPRMDIYEDNGNVVTEVELPKVDPKNIDLEVKDNVLKIEAKTEKKKEEKRKGYYRKEISSGFFKRALPLPVEVTGKKAKADYRDGILKITIPKIKPKKKIKKEQK